MSVSIAAPRRRAEGPSSAGTGGRTYQLYRTEKEKRGWLKRGRAGGAGAHHAWLYTGDCTARGRAQGCAPHQEIHAERSLRPRGAWINVRCGSDDACG